MVYLYKTKFRNNENVNLVRLLSASVLHASKRQTVSFLRSNGIFFKKEKRFRSKSKKVLYNGGKLKSSKFLNEFLLIFALMRKFIKYSHWKSHK